MENLASQLLIAKIAIYEKIVKIPDRSSTFSEMYGIYRHNSSKSRCAGRSRKPSGFTLIELLVAMTVVAVLMGIALVSLQGARKSARDGKRKADLEQIRSALEMCRTDTGSYPSSIYTNISCMGKTYLTGTPKDPLDNISYYYSGSTDSYVLCAALETTSQTVSGCGSCGTRTCNYKVTSP